MSSTASLRPSPPRSSPPPSPAARTRSSSRTPAAAPATPAFAITAGTLAPGLTLSPTGLLAGTPAAAAAGQTYSFSVAVTVGTQTSPAVPFTLTVASVPVITTTTLPAGNVSIPYRQQLAFTGGVGTPTFAITAGSLPAASGLTLSPAGLLAGTPTAVATYTFSVTVTVGTQSSAPQPYTLSIFSLVVTSGPTAMGEVGLAFSFRLAAAGGTAPYTFSLAASSAPLPTGLTLNAATGLITGTPTIAGSTSGIVLQANDSAAASATQSMTFTINPARSAASNALLNGSYAFLLTGFDSLGRPQATAGRFTADGAGNITGGSLDANGTGLATAQTAVALLPGTYAAGPDNRGKLNLVTAAGTSTFTFALDTVAAGIAQGGSLSEYDLSGQTRTGILALQASPLVLPTTLTTGYAFGLQGFAPGSTATTLVHRSAAGEFQLSASAALASAELLLSSTPTATPVVATSGTLALAANGRGTLALTLPNLGTLNFVIYEVSPTRLFLLSADPSATANLLSGQALAQTTTTFSNATLNAAAVFHAEKLTSGSPDVQLGLLIGSGSGTATQSFDENSAGALTASTTAGTYTVAANGRATLTLAPSGLGGCTNCTSGSTFAYLTGPNQGFLMDFSSGALSGFFEPQTSTTLAGGAYSLAAPEPLAPGSISATGTANLTPGTLTATEDVVNQLTLTPSLAVTGSDAVSASGRFTTSISGPGYVVSATRVETLDPTAKPVLQVLQHQ